MELCAEAEQLTCPRPLMGENNPREDINNVAAKGCRGNNCSGPVRVLVRQRPFQRKCLFAGLMTGTYRQGDKPSPNIRLFPGESAPEGTVWDEGDVIERCRSPSLEQSDSQGRSGNGG